MANFSGVRSSVRRCLLDSWNVYQRRLASLSDACGGDLRNVQGGSDVVDTRYWFSAAACSQAGAVQKSRAVVTCGGEHLSCFAHDCSLVLSHRILLLREAAGQENNLYIIVQQTYMTASDHIFGERIFERNRCEAQVDCPGNHDIAKKAWTRMNTTWFKRGMVMNYLFLQ